MVGVKFFWIGSSGCDVLSVGTSLRRAPAVPFVFSGSINRNRQDTM